MWTCPVADRWSGTMMLQLERSAMLLQLAMLAGVVDGFMPLLSRHHIFRLGSPRLPMSARSTSLPFARRGIAAENFMNAAATPNVWSQTVRKDMEAMGATYCILWQKKGDEFVVVQDYTTEARRKAMRRVRGDDKLFATESRRYTLPVNGTGPIATAARKNMQVTIKDTSQMKRAALAKEFGIKVYRMSSRACKHLRSASAKANVHWRQRRCTDLGSDRLLKLPRARAHSQKIHFVPVADGVLEYGTPSSEEMVLLELLTLTVRQMLWAGSIRSFFRLTGEMLSCLRLLIVVGGQENNLVSGLSKAAVSFLSNLNELEQESVTTGSKASVGPSVVSKLTSLALKALLAVLAPMAWAFTFVLDYQHERQKRKQQQTERDLAAQMGLMQKVFTEADKDGNGVLRLCCVCLCCP